MKGFIYFLILLAFLGGCTGDSVDSRSVTVEIDSVAGHDHTDDLRYVCPMHPDVVKDGPGQCPVCGMDLVPTSKGHQDSETVDIMLNESQIRLANIMTAPVRGGTMQTATAIQGQLKVDEQKSQVISSRSTGRIERLFVKETGGQVVKGQPLYVLYSEALLTLQREYLIARAQYQRGGESEHYKPLLNAAEQKLRLYGLTTAQIQSLRDDALAPRITLTAPTSGIVTAIEASEGQYVSEGSVLYRLDDISSLWVEAEVYANELPLVREGDRIRVAMNGEMVGATIDFVSPEYRNNTQIAVLRASVKNPDHKWKPGSFVEVLIDRLSSEGVRIPVDAVIRDAHGAHVYVTSGRNNFVPRPVKTGMEDAYEVEVNDGLSPGDTVVVTGAYLLYSEYVLRKGTNPVAVHAHH